MSRAGVGCRVMVDGLRLDDGCIPWAAPPTDYPLAGEGLSVDDGLKIVWGRTTVLEQPQPSSCSFTVADDPGGIAYTPTLRVGSRVEVFADGTLPGSPSSSAFIDGSYETRTPPGTATGGTLAWSTLRAHDGTHSAQAVGGGAAFSVTLAPDALQPAGQNPDAWDGLPTTAGGDTWQLSAWVWVLPGIQVTLRAALYTGPYAGAATVGPTPLAVTAPGAGGWQLLTAPYTASSTGRWVGVDLAGQSTATWAATPGTWADQPAGAVWADYGGFHADQVDVSTPGGGGPIQVLAFSGRITDLSVAWDDQVGGPVAQVTASDFLADLGNRPVGDEPWASESVQARVGRVLALAAQPGEPPIVADIAPTVAAIPVSWQDVDRQPAAGLLTDLAQSVDAVLWSATHVVSGPYLRLEDPSARPAMYQLALVGGVIVIHPLEHPAGAVQPLDLSACDMLRDPVSFVTDVGDVSTRVRVQWLEQTLDDNGLPAPTTRVELVEDAERTAAYGSRSVSVSTLLTSSADAVTVAERILARTAGDWRAAGITVADADFVTPDDVAAEAQLRLLSGVQRGGLPLRITDMPAWNPVSDPLPAYLEGGEYTFTAGGWQLALVISRATGLGQSATWQEIPAAWQWVQWDPTLSWADLLGVAAPPST